MIAHGMIPNWRDHVDIQNYIPDRYNILKKFFTFPYMIVEVTTFNGSALVAKPECWADPHLTLIERFNPVPPNQRIAFSPYKYNAIPGSPTDTIYQTAGDSDEIFGDDNGDFLDFSVYITDLPTIPIVNNGAISYLAANAHGIAFQFQNADWSQQRALNANATSYDQASQGMNLMGQLTGIGMDLDTATTANANLVAQGRAGINAVTGIGRAGMAADPAAGLIGAGVDAAAQATNAALTTSVNNANLALRNSARSNTNAANTNNAAYMRDTNKKLADWSAKGDYANSIAAINAKVQDAALIQPSVSGQAGGDTFNLVNNNIVVSVRVKMLDHASMKLVGEYWLRYGYAVRQFYTPPASLQCMTHFTYWRMQETYIISSTMPESMKQIIRGIFEKGVTVWSNPPDIGVIDMAINQPLPGITLP
jgi:hypothetical protein